MNLLKKLVLHGALPERWEIVGTLAISVAVDKLIGLRVSPEQEAQGLDLSQHGEEGYGWASM